MTTTTQPQGPRSTTLQTQAAPRLCIVVLSWNSRNDLLACLASLRSEITESDRVLVVDNGSSDDSVATVRRSHHWCEIIENRQNLGYAGGNNVGVQWAIQRGFQLVFLLNQDTVVEPGALSELVQAAARDPRAGVWQPLLVQYAHPNRIDNLGLTPRRWLGGGVAGRNLSVSRAPKHPRPIFGASGAATLISVELLKRIGGLDTDLFLLCEDFDLMFRARIAGADPKLIPAARVRHRGGVSERRRSRRAALARKQLLQRNTVALALSYWPAHRLLLAAPLLCWRALVALVLAPFSPGQAGPTLWRRYWRQRRDRRGAMVAKGMDRWFA